MLCKNVKKSIAGLSSLALLAGLCAAPALAQQAKPADGAVTWGPAPNSVVNPSKNISLSGWEAYKGKSPKPSVDQKLEDPILKGAIDIHAHFGPDAYDRQWDAFEIAKLAKARGMRGLVLKNHWTESAGTAWLVRKYADVPGLEVFGGLALNSTVGGVNPQAVRYFAEVEGHYAKVVWMPSHDSEKEVKYLKETRPYVIVSEGGKLLPSVLEVLDLIAQYKLTLATGHVTPEEMLQIVAEARKRGVDRIILTHPGLGPMFTDPTIEQLKQATAMGAYAEIVATQLGERMKDSTIKAIRAVGPAHCIISSDSGLTGSRNHPDALVIAARTLREAGFSEADLNLMFKTNPAKVLGLAVQ